MSPDAYNVLIGLGSMVFGVVFGAGVVMGTLRTKINELCREVRAFRLALYGNGQDAQFVRTAEFERLRERLNQHEVEGHV